MNETIERALERKKEKGRDDARRYRVKMKRLHYESEMRLQELQRKNRNLRNTLRSLLEERQAFLSMVYHSGAATPQCHHHVSSCPPSPPHMNVNMPLNMPVTDGSLVSIGTNVGSNIVRSEPSSSFATRTTRAEAFTHVFAKGSPIMNHADHKGHCHQSQVHPIPSKSNISSAENNFSASGNSVLIRSCKDTKS